MSNEANRLEVEKVIHDSIGWALTKDIDRLFSIVAQDDDFFIFHPDSKSTIVGFDAFKSLGERTGPSMQAVIARVVAEEPRGISGQRRAVPWHVEAAVKQALEKLPADRFATAGEFAAALATPLTRETSTRWRRPATRRCMAVRAVAGWCSWVRASWPASSAPGGWAVPPGRPTRSSAA